jgi:hypothetical protein
VGLCCGASLNTRGSYLYARLTIILRIFSALEIWKHRRWISILHFRSFCQCLSRGYAGSRTQVKLGEVVEATPKTLHTLDLPSLGNQRSKLCCDKPVRLCFI